MTPHSMASMRGLCFLNRIYNLHDIEPQFLIFLYDPEEDSGISEATEGNTAGCEWWYNKWPAEEKASKVFLPQPKTREITWP